MSFLGIDCGKSSVFDAIAIGHVLAIALGMVFLARALGLGGFGAVMAAVIASLNGYMVNHLSHTVILAPIAMGIWGMGCLVHALRRNDIRWAVGSGLFLASAILAGHWQTVLFSFYAAGFGAVVLTVSLAVSTRSPRRLWSGMLLTATTFAVAVLASLVQILPSLLLLGNSLRRELTLDFATEYSLPARQLAGMLMPSLYRPLIWRTPADIRWDLWWSTWGGDGAWEFMFWCGIAGFVFMLFGLIAHIHRLAAWLLAAVFAFTIAAALGKEGGLYPWLYEHAPAFRQIRIPPRMMWVGFVAGGLLAGLGVDLVARIPRSSARMRAGGITAMILCGLAVAGTLVLVWAGIDATSWRLGFERLLVINRLFRVGVDRAAGDFVEDIVQQLLVGAIVVVAVMSWLIVVSARRPSSRVLATIAIAVVFLELAVYGMGKNVAVGHKGFDNAWTDMHLALSERPPGRMLNLTSGPWCRNTGLVSGFDYAGGYNPLMIRWVQAFQPFEDSTSGLKTREHILDLWNVSDVLLPARYHEAVIDGSRVNLPRSGRVLLGTGNANLPANLRFEAGKPVPVPRAWLVAGASCAASFGDGTEVGYLEIEPANGEPSTTRPLRLGENIAEWKYDAFTGDLKPAHRRPSAAYILDEDPATSPTTFFAALIDNPSTAPVRAFNVVVTAKPPVNLAVTHLVAEAEGLKRMMPALRGIGYRNLPSRDKSWIILRRTTPLGYAWLVPEADAVSYKKDFKFVLAKYHDPAFEPSKTVLVEKQVYPREGIDRLNAPDPDGFQGVARVVRGTPEQFTVLTDSNQRGWLVMSHTWYPGWKASIDGVPVPLARANGGHCTVPVPAGKHKVEMDYYTPRFIAGAAISVPAWLLSLGVILFARPRSSRRRP
jgi:hypothetical protein